MTTFDTHDMIKLLMQGGLQESAAKAVLKAIQASKSSDLNSFASKGQVAILEKDVENIMHNSATKADLLETEKRLIFMIGGVAITICGIIIGALKYI